MSATKRATTHADWSHYPPAQLPRVVVPAEDVYDETPFPESRWPRWKRHLALAGVLAMELLCYLAIIGLLGLIARALWELREVQGW